MLTTGLHFHAVFLIRNYLIIFLCTSRKKRNALFFIMGKLGAALQVECKNLA